MNIKHLIIADSKTEIAMTMYAGYNEQRAKNEIDRLQKRDTVIRILYKVGNGRYQKLKG